MIAITWRARMSSEHRSSTLRSPNHAESESTLRCPVTVARAGPLAGAGAGPAGMMGVGAIGGGAMVAAAAGAGGNSTSVSSCCPDTGGGPNTERSTLGGTHGCEGWFQSSAAGGETCSCREGTGGAGGGAAAGMGGGGVVRGRGVLGGGAAVDDGAAV